MASESNRRRSVISRFTEKYSNVEEATIFNLPKYKTGKEFNKIRYDVFLEFYKQTNTILDEEIRNNTGEIMQIFPVNKEFRNILESIRQDYDDMYLNPIKMEELHDGKYPKFFEHMFKKSYKVYEKYEKLLDLPSDANGNAIRIENQSDEEILKTLQLRIKGLKECQSYKPESMNETEKEYYDVEYKRENEKYEKLLMDDSITESSKVEQQCKNIFYNLDALNKYDKTQYNMEIIKIFLSNPIEELYARTYLPIECFDIIINNGNTIYKINFDKVEELLKIGDRNYRQFVFGFYSDELLQTVRKIKPFLFEAGGMIFKDNYYDSCNQLVNWSLYLNMLYCRCGIMNTYPLCPVRFVMPTDIVPIQRTNKNNTINIRFQIRDKLPLLDLFDNDEATNCTFIGIIALKYYHKELKNPKGELRIWYFFVFKNNDLSNTSRQNTITGIRDKIILCNYRLRQINMFGLFEKHNVTHYELLHYITLSNQQTNKVYFYKPLKYNDDKNIFISRLPNLDTNSFLQELQLVRVNIKKEDIPGDYHTIPKTYISISYNTSNTNINKMLLHSGGSIIFNKNNKNNNDINNDINYINKTNIKTTVSDNELYFSKHTLSNNYNDFLELLEIVERIGWYSDNIKNNYISPNREYIYKYLQCSYPYLLVDIKDSGIKHKKITNKSINTITKYNPISTDFYKINEWVQKIKLFDYLNKSDKILYIGSSLALLEYLSYYKYDFSEITNIITLQQNYFENLLYDWKTYIKNISSVYKVNNINFDDVIYNISNLDNAGSNISKNNKLIFWSVDRVISGIGKFNSYYNIPLYISGILFSLQHISKNGILIYNIESVAYKHCADIVLIISQYFTNWELFYPEVHSRYKRSGTTVIFTNFKGINTSDIKYLEKLLNDVKKIYTDEGRNFNIRDIELRHNLHIIRKPIPTNPQVNINSFLDYNINDKIYEPFKTFNDARYMEQILYVSKMIDILNSPIRDKYLNQKLPTDNQIISSILYCKKYDIPYWDKYNTTKIDSFISKNILSDMYGLHEPILYQFKTPFKTYIADKIVLNPLLQPIHSRVSNKSQKILKTIHSRIHTTKKSKSKSKSLSLTKKRDTLGSLFRDIFASNHTKNNNKDNKNKITSSRITSKSKTYSTKTYSRQTRKSSFRRSNISLMNPIFTSNNQLMQVGRLIDSRRDFTKPQAKPGSKYDPQTLLYDTLKKQLRYYKGTSQARNIANLDIMVQERLGDRSISQAWLKMYEIITDCNLVPHNQKGTFHSFHFCEAPGTFINALNNYIRTKTSYTDFEWHAQSLNPRIAKIKDTFGLIERHHERWDWGADNTGDITQVANIRHYKRKIQQRPPVQLITSDCGLEWGNPKYELVAFASYVAILNGLSKGGTMVYKILSPIDLPLLWNLIYITYTNFKEMYFFKPVQNAQSREFYIVAKDYMGTDSKVLDKLLEIVQRWGKLEKQGYKAKWVEELDLFGDTYPEEFVYQVINISEKLAQNYVNSIERIVYYVDNYKALGDEYKKHIERYVGEKNEDWIRRYRPRKLDNKWVL